ncbi:hypothetical protein E2562_028086 [Oryza meyeriana var. granulata]|uniref:Uncharacterized protein n=1 Tax=Oryza meyeriana var. granulata TaxID=110450 RepID=A0A6G1C094_9ORYZ|nr:hypothetical protein E2562_028086 [Oryza meyeriana var. granulata]
MSSSPSPEAAAGNSSSSFPATLAACHLSLSPGGRRSTSSPSLNPHPPSPFCHCTPPPLLSYSTAPPSSGLDLMAWLGRTGSGHLETALDRSGEGEVEVVVLTVPLIAAALGRG